MIKKNQEVLQEVNKAMHTVHDGIAMTVFALTCVNSIAFVHKLFHSMLF